MTMGEGTGIISWRPGEQNLKKHIAKKFDKKCKKVLDKGNVVCYIKQANRTAVLYLVN